MKSNRLSSALASVLLLTATQVAAEDVTEGTVLAYDRKANVLVMRDRSVFPLEKLTGQLPEGLQAGDRIRISYDSNEDDGITAINSITIVPK